MRERADLFVAGAVAVTVVTKNAAGRVMRSRAGR